MLLVNYQYAAAVPKRAEHHTNGISLAPTRSVSKLTLKKRPIHPLTMRHCIKA